MATPILAIKLNIPPSRPKVIPRLIERLNEGPRLGRKQTFISAPAGFGKTTLVSEWVAGCQRPVACLPLDESDYGPSQFLTYLVAALQTIDTDLGIGRLSLLQSPPPLPIEVLLTSLINEVAEASQSIHPRPRRLPSD